MHTSHGSNLSTLEKFVDHDRCIWEALAGSPDLPVMLVGESATVHFANRAAAAFCLKPTPDDVVGRRLHDMFPLPYAQERQELIRRAIHSHRRLCVDACWSGRAVRERLWPLPASESAPEPAVIMVVSPRGLPCDSDNGAPLVRAEHGDLGPLAKLTDGELRVLAYIAEGMSTAEIGKHLHRSRKTIEWYRSSLGQKLGCSNRVELARLAIIAGITTDYPVPPLPRKNR